MKRTLNHVDFWNIFNVIENPLQFKLVSSANTDRDDSHTVVIDLTIDGRQLLGIVVDSPQHVVQ